MGQVKNQETTIGPDLVRPGLWSLYAGMACIAVAVCFIAFVLMPFMAQPGRRHGDLERSLDAFGQHQWFFLLLSIAIGLIAAYFYHRYRSRYFVGKIIFNDREKQVHIQMVSLYKRRDTEYTIAYPELRVLLRQSVANGFKRFRFSRKKLVVASFDTSKGHWENQEETVQLLVEKLREVCPNFTETRN